MFTREVFGLKEEKEGFLMRLDGDGRHFRSILSSYKEGLNYAAPPSDFSLHHPLHGPRTWVLPKKL